MIQLNVGDSKGSGCVVCNSIPRPGCTSDTCGIFAYNPFQNMLLSQGLGEDAMSVSTDGFSVLFDYDSPHFLFSCADSFLLEGLASSIRGMIGLARTTTSLQIKHNFHHPSSYLISLLFVCLLPLWNDLVTYS